MIHINIIWISDVVDLSFCKSGRFGFDMALFNRSAVPGFWCQTSFDWNSSIESSNTNSESEANKRSEFCEFLTAKRDSSVSVVNRKQIVNVCLVLE